MKNSICHRHGILAGETYRIDQFIILFSHLEKCQSLEIAAFGNRRPRFRIALGFPFTIYCRKEAAFRYEREKEKEHHSFKLKKTDKKRNNTASSSLLE